MRYVEFKSKRMEEINAFPILWAFSDEQLEKGLEKWGITDKKEIVRIPLNGGFIRKKDVNNLVKMMERQKQADIEAFKDDAFLIDAMCFELANHEYEYTRDEISALEALGIDEASMDDRTRKCLEIAKRNICNP